jgi:hypothetical protein
MCNEGPVQDFLEQISDAVFGPTSSVCMNQKTSEDDDPTGKCRSSSTPPEDSTNFTTDRDFDPGHGEYDG